MRKSVLLMLLTLSLPLSAWQENRVADDPGEVSTFVRDVQDSPVKAFRGVVEVPANITQLLAVSAAVDTFSEWVFQAKGGESMQQPEPATYIAFRGIWPVSDRDVVLVNSIEQSAQSGAVTLRSQLLEGAEERRGYVRIPAFDNSFVFTPLADGMTRIEFETFVDPGGRVPAWLSNLISNRAPLVTLEGMKEQLQKERFQVVAEEDKASFPGVEDIDYSYWE